MENPQRYGAFRANGPEARQDSRYRMLDDWRGLACLLVVVHHAGGALSWGDVEGAGVGNNVGWWLLLAIRKMNLGVSLFFVISGYCIAASASSTARRGGSAWGFMGRRVWRIYPPYWAAMFGFAAVVVLLDGSGLGRFCRGPIAIDLDPVRAIDWRHWVGNLTLTETWRPYVWGPPRNVYTSVAWSLCFEEQFYMICFLALWLAPRRFYAVLGLATLAIASVRVWFWWNGGLGSIRGTFPLLWHEFAVGVAVFYRLNVARRTSTKRLLELGLVALVAVGCATRGEGTATASAFGLVLIVLRRWDNRWSGLPWLSPFRASGLRCYSIYLAHLPVVVVGNRWLYELGLTGFWGRALVMIPLVSIAGVAAGWAFHALIEARFLNPPVYPSRLGHAARTHARRLRALAGAT